MLRDIVLTPDFTGDGKPDLLAIDPRARGVRVYSGDGRGGVTGVATRGGGWQVMTKLIAAGDRTGDGKADLLAVRNDGSLVLYTGDGAGWVRSGRVIATGFGVMDSVVTAGDVTGDGHPDLLAVNQGNGRLYLYPGTADGGVGSAVVWGGGWQRLDQLVSGPGRRPRPQRRRRHDPPVRRADADVLRGRQRPADPDVHVRPRLGRPRQHHLRRGLER